MARASPSSAAAARRRSSGLPARATLVFVRERFFLAADFFTTLEVARTL